MTGGDEMVKNPFAFTKNGGVLTIDSPLALLEELYDSPSFGARLFPVALESEKVISHFRLENAHDSARGIEGHPDGTERHIQVQLEYLKKGYLLEESLVFTDSSKYVLDCYDPRTAEIVEVVDNHGDIEKARVLEQLGFTVVWHFVSEVNFSRAYERYGKVICDY